MTFLTAPNEMKLSIADTLPIYDINALSRTTSAINSLLIRYIYRRGLVETSRRGTPYFYCALEGDCVAGARKFVELCIEINVEILQKTGRLRTDGEPYE